MSGPFQTMSTSSSFAAFTAPACTLFQNSCVVPFGMTAMRTRGGRSAARRLALAARRSRGERQDKSEGQGEGQRERRGPNGKAHFHPLSIRQLIVVHPLEDGVLRVVVARDAPAGPVGSTTRPGRVIAAIAGEHARLIAASDGAEDGRAEEHGLGLARAARCGSR